MDRNLSALSVMGIVLALGACQRSKTPVPTSGHRNLRGQFVALAKLSRGPVADEFARVEALTTYPAALAYEKRAKEEQRLLDLIATYRAVLAKQPKHLIARSRLALLLVELGFPRTGARESMTHTKHHPDDLDHRYLMALLWEQYVASPGYRKATISLYRDLLRKRPNYRSPTGETAEQIRARLQRLTQGEKKPKEKL